MFNNVFKDESIIIVRKKSKSGQNIRKTLLHNTNIVMNIVAMLCLKVFCRAYIHILRWSWVVMSYNLFHCSSLVAAYNEFLLPSISFVHSRFTPTILLFARRFLVRPPLFVDWRLCCTRIAKNISGFKIREQAFWCPQSWRVQTHSTLLFTPRTGELLHSLVLLTSGKLSISKWSNLLRQYRVGFCVRCVPNILPIKSIYISVKIEIVFLILPIIERFS